MKRRAAPGLMMTNDQMTGAAAALHVARRVLIPLHLAPDGDSVGSALALGQALKQMGREYSVASHDPVPERYAFLPGSESIASPASIEGEFDTAVLLDCGSFSRIGSAADLITSRTRTIVIDHHLTNNGFGHVCWVDPRAAATAEMLMELLQHMEVKFTSGMAQSLYTGLATDTGFFCHANTTARAMRLAAGLLDLGAQPHVVDDFVNRNTPLGHLRLLGRALERVQVACDGFLAWSVLRSDDYRASQVAGQASEGIINYLRSIAGVRVAVLFCEKEDGAVKISLRSRDPIDVGCLAAELGGGGHARAAGAQVAGPVQDVIPKVLARLDLLCKGDHSCTEARGETQ